VQQSFFNFDGDYIEFSINHHYAMRPIIKKVNKIDNKSVSLTLLSINL
jgi:hypothetical protein